MNQNREMDLLLGADIDELRGLGTSEVARLVRERDDIRILAARILAGLDETNSAIDGFASTRAGQAGSRGVEAASRTRDAVAAATAPRPPVRGPRFRRLGLAAGLAIAAIAMITLYAPQANRPRTGRPAIETPPLSASLGAGSDRPFAVFETANPDIVVVWLFPKNQEDSR
jgi:hypothetical protein